MLTDRLARDLYAEICRIPLIDPHSHINPHRAASRSLDDILGYHYYTELAHSAGMPQSLLAPELPAADRVRAMSTNQAYWAVLSNRSMWARIARTRSRGDTSLPSGACDMPAEWASSV